MLLFVIPFLQRRNLYSKSDARKYLTFKGQTFKKKKGSKRPEYLIYVTYQDMGQRCLMQFVVTNGTDITHTESLCCSTFLLNTAREKEELCYFCHMDICIPRMGQIITPWCLFLLAVILCMTLHSGVDNWRIPVDSEVKTGEGRAYGGEVLHQQIMP